MLLNSNQTKSINTIASCLSCKDSHDAALIVSDEEALTGTWGSDPIFTLKNNSWN